MSVDVYMYVHACVRTDMYTLTSRNIDSDSASSIENGR